METKKNLRPPLKWAGGKRWLVPHLKPLWEKYPQRRLVEPFCGGLAVTLGLVPEKALLNDINPHAVNFYLQIQRGLSVSLPMQKDKELFYDYRKQFNDLVRDENAGTPEGAQLFYYLNRTCFNGLCRFNSKGEFNVPFGRYKTINYAKDFDPYQPLFSEWDFSVGDFEALSLGEEDFIYADPPYDVEFTQYAKENFNWEDQERLAQWLSQHPGPVVLSNQATDRIVSLYKKLGFSLQYLDAPRMISCTGDRKPAREVLATHKI